MSVIFVQISNNVIDGHFRHPNHLSYLLLGVAGNQARSQPSGSGGLGGTDTRVRSTGESPSALKPRINCDNSPAISFSHSPELARQN